MNPIDNLRAARRGVGATLALLAVLALGVAAPAQSEAGRRLLAAAAENPRLQLEERLHQVSDTRVLVGSYRVWEDRAARTGRQIDLNLIVLPAAGDDPEPDAIFVFHGGPGAAATGFLDGLASSWQRERRDIILLDQRGTGRSNPLRVALPGGDDDLQGYLDPIFRVEVFRAALPRLQRIADLRLYTTPIAMDDANEVREALGYERVNLWGGSYGSRAALVYMRRHPETVRTATLNGIAPIAFTNPLYHASAAQVGMERLIEECRSDPRYRVAFPDLRERVEGILERLEEEPVGVTVPHPATGEPAEVTLDRNAFAEALRVMMYYTGTNRKVPLLLLRASEGDFRPFAIQAIESNRGLRGLLCMGMLMSVVGSEDIPRIDPDSIPELCEGTFLGDGRVRRQMAVAGIWTRGEVPPEYGLPVSVDVPVLLLSGTHDPVTPPLWGEEAARHLPASLHLVVPGAHGVGGPCIERIQREFLERGSVEGLDTSCVEDLRMAPLALPEGGG